MPSYIVGFSDPIHTATAMFASRTHCPIAYYTIHNPAHSASFFDHTQAPRAVHPLKVFLQRTFRIFVFF
jgi:hypothetical protein